MKKIIAILLTGLMVISLTACSEETDMEVNDNNVAQENSASVSDETNSDDETVDTEEGFDFNGTMWKRIAYIQDDGTRLEGDEFNEGMNSGDQHFEFREDGVFCSTFDGIEEFGVWEESGTNRIRIEMDGSGITRSGQYVDGELKIGPDILTLNQIFTLVE